VSVGETAASPEPRAAWVEAEALATAAIALLDDPSVPDWTAAALLRRGHAALAIAIGREDADATRRLAVDDDTTLDAMMLREIATGLAHAVAAAGESTFTPGRRAAARRRLRRKVLLGTLILMIVAALLVLTATDWREGPWRAQFFDNVELEGTPVVEVREGDVTFDWRRDVPIKGVPADHFSARFDTCMVLDEELLVAFQLVSDDGSRLFVDGALVVDNWGIHAKRSAGAGAKLAAGTHHLRVEYFDAEARAFIDLMASLRGELPTQLPARILHLPGDDPDDPCAGVPRP
jgi:hypothetical protein